MFHPVIQRSRGSKLSDRIRRFNLGLINNEKEDEYPQSDTSRSTKAPYTRPKPPTTAVDSELGRLGMGVNLDVCPGRYGDQQDDGEQQRILFERNAESLSNAMSASVAVLQALNARFLVPSRRDREEPGPSVDVIIKDIEVCEKKFNSTPGNGPLELLLSLPDELDDPTTEGGHDSLDPILSSEMTSAEVLPSLDDASSLSDESIATPRGRRSVRLRRPHSRSSTSISVSGDDHPLSTSDLDISELDFRVFTPQNGSRSVASSSTPAEAGQKSAFKSHITASLRALKSAAMSLSNLTTPVLMPEDFLTRSIVSIDPQVPFTDERMPKFESDHPPAALRRYLNPSMNPSSRLTPGLARKIASTNFTASIQLQTYKNRRVVEIADEHRQEHSLQEDSDRLVTGIANGPVARQRDMRENGDFIRIAVMEMAMRRTGKLDDHKPGRARWALPPRKPSRNPYKIGADGVPVRWTSWTLTPET